MVVVGRLLHCPIWTVGAAGSPVAVHSFATGNGWHGVLRPQPVGVNQILDRACARGSHPTRPRGLAAPGWWSRGPGPATDVPVAQPVVDQREQLAAGGDLGDVRATPFADAGSGGADRAAVH